MKRNVILTKSSIEQKFKDIKEKYYGKIILNRTEQAFILKNYFEVERMYVSDTISDYKAGKSIYIIYKDGHEETVSVSSILKKIKK
jgi:hypothetical protein